MTQPRMNLYATPHKGLRNGISQLITLAGSTTASDPASLAKLKELGSEIFALLELHAHSEDTVVLKALESKVAGSTTKNLAEHVELEASVSALAAQLDAITVGSAPNAVVKFYADLSAFYARYLDHMAMEEGEMNALIWAHFTDQELLGQHGYIMSTLTPDQIMSWFKYIIPALNLFERTIVMGGFKANAPAPFFDAVLAMLSSRMAKADLDAMVAAIA